MNADTNGTLDIVVVSYWSSTQLAAMLAGLPGDRSVTVVDNAEGTDVAARRVCAEQRVAYVPLGRNTGFGHASNVGARRGSAPFILFVNPDCRIDELGIETLVGTLSDRPGLAACAPLLTAADSRRRQIFGGAAPGLWTALAYLVLPDDMLGRFCVWATTTRARGPVRVDWLSGACLLIRREAFVAVGGFREDLFMYNEDIDLGARLRRGGWAEMLDPRVTARHGGGRSADVAVDVPGIWSRSTVRYLLSTGRSLRPIVIGLLLLGGMCRRHLMALLRGRTGATFARQFGVELVRVLRSRSPT